MHFLAVLISTVCLVQAVAFDNTRYDNVSSLRAPPLGEGLLTLPGIQLAV
jgi:hypothetical protein